MVEDSSPSRYSPTVENNLQPFFVLHRASPPRKSTAKARRKIDLSPKASDASAEEYSDSLRLETFKILWSDIDSKTKDILKNINANVYGEIEKWVHRSFDAIRASHQKLDVTSATCPYPIIDGSSVAATGASSQIFTALLFTKNMEFCDDILTYAELGVLLQAHGCHVANLTSLDFSAKNGVGGCLKTLLRQFLTVGIDAPDMSILASWCTEGENCEKPVVVIIEDVERCCAPVLADFIIMLREWVVKIPIVLILGLATTVDALRNILCSKVCSHLSICEFTLGTPAERMDAVVEAILLKNCESFSVGKDVSNFLRNYFCRHDGTLTLFIRALRIAMVQHIYVEPSSIALRNFVHGEGAEGIDDEDVLLEDSVLKQTLELPSLQRYRQPSTNCLDWTYCLSELKRLRRLRSSTVMCLHEVGKYRKITLLDLYCQTLQYAPDNASDSVQTQSAKENATPLYDSHLIGVLQNKSHGWAFQILSDLSVSEVCKLLSRWEHHTRGMPEIQEKIKEVQSLTKLEENRSNGDQTEASRRHTARNHVNQKRDKTTANDKVATFLQDMVRQYMQPIESMPLNEVVLFDDVDRLRTALIGDPRRRIQADLLESNKFLKCSCCRKNTGAPIPSMHPTSILYSLAQEHGDLINLHEWFHSYKAILCQPPPPEANKKRSRTSPSPKKRKNPNPPQKRSDASIQAEFCRAVMELQMAGLIRMPSKKRPDYVQRTAFGL